eukprot:10670172-Alexandrium_andersonii.AAC.1
MADCGLRRIRALAPARRTARFTLPAHLFCKRALRKFFRFASSAAGALNKNGSTARREKKQHAERDKSQL